MVVEDEACVRHTLAASLREAQVAVDEAESAGQARNMAGCYPYDVFVVDVRLPDGPSAGFEFVRWLREQHIHTPVLLLTARDAVEDRIAGLDVGADDYLTKPFSIGEVHARLRALLRRSRQTPAIAFESGRLRVDWNTRTVSVDGQRANLTAKEYGVLELLASHPGRIFTRDEITSRVWDECFSAVTNIVDVYVKNLRRKLGDGTVETVRGLGYRFPSA
ncbi:response regulator [Deinococcus aquiradiocola]|uniref:Response regulator n=2 Tax=Deinococcus aquiradiocola TaxID=393059 RepID=A0A917PPQ4_9DEIO|nr:response regulator [Deinococcus aquiradiocola]